MDDLVVRIEAARKDALVMNGLVSDYVPLLKKEVGKFNGALTYDEKMSLAMLVFVNCINQYSETKGNFISFLSVSIKNRLIDQVRINEKDSKVISLNDSNHTNGNNGGSENNRYGSNENSGYVENQASLQLYKKEQEEETLRSEIQILQDELSRHSLTFSDLEKSCPKQIRSRKQCIKIAKIIINTPNMMKKFSETGRIPQAELSLLLGISVKTIEKYRKYIVALIIIHIGDYGGIKSFIPFWSDDESSDE